MRVSTDNYRPQTKLPKCNVFTSVCLEFCRGVSTFGRHPPGQTRQTPPWQADTPTPWQADTPQHTDSAADGTHPTGMHSCYKSILVAETDHMCDTSFLAPLVGDEFGCTMWTSSCPGTWAKRLIFHDLIRTFCAKRVDKSNAIEILILARWCKKSTNPRTEMILPSVISLGNSPQINSVARNKACHCVFWVGSFMYLIY